MVSASPVDPVQQLEALPGGAPSWRRPRPGRPARACTRGQPPHEIGHATLRQHRHVRERLHRRPAGDTARGPAVEGRAQRLLGGFQVVQVELHEAELLVGHGVERCRPSSRDEQVAGAEQHAVGRGRPASSSGGTGGRATARAPGRMTSERCSGAAARPRRRGARPAGGIRRPRSTRSAGSPGAGEPEVGHRLLPAPEVGARMPPGREAPRCGPPARLR